MPSKRTPAPCSCGACYADYRTGLTFGCVKAMMWRGSDDPKDWRSRSRRAVLGFWRELKISMFLSDHGACP